MVGGVGCWRGGLKARVGGWKRVKKEGRVRAREKRGGLLTIVIVSGE